MSDPALIHIASQGFTAEIESLGAQLHAWCDPQGRDLLWNGDPAVWNGRAPLLFPIVGGLNGGRYRLGEAHYDLPRHGLARRKPFQLAGQATDQARLRLAWDAQTLAVYPFRFELEMTFALAGPRLSFSAQVTNRGETPMPASFGYHPAFRWPLPYGAARADHAVIFSAEEPGPAWRIDADGLVKPQPAANPVDGRRLALDDSLFVDDALILDPLRSRSLSFGPPQGKRLEIDLGGAPYLGLWTKPGAPFLCVEPWWGHADPQGFGGDFTEKPGVFALAPGESRTMAMSATLAGEG